MLLLLALALTLGALPAQAAEKPLTMEFTGPVTLTEGKSAVVLKTKVNSTESGVISYKLVDNVDKNKPVVFEQTVENVKAGDAVEWTAPYEQQQAYQAASGHLHHGRQNLYLQPVL